MARCRRRPATSRLVEPIRGRGSRPAPVRRVRSSPRRSDILAAEGDDFLHSVSPRRHRRSGFGRAVGSRRPRRRSECRSPRTSAMAAVSATAETSAFRDPRRPSEPLALPPTENCRGQDQRLCGVGIRELANARRDMPGGAVVGCHLARLAVVREHRADIAHSNKPYETGGSVDACLPQTPPLSSMRERDESFRPRERSRDRDCRGTCERQSRRLAPPTDHDPIHRQPTVSRSRDHARWPSRRRKRSRRG
jgi:hypothetical protein